VRHRLIGCRNARRERGVYFDVGALAPEIDPVVMGVSAGNGDEGRVWAGRAFDNWRTR
jgi:hypothetical protein